MDFFYFFRQTVKRRDIPSEPLLGILNASVRPIAILCKGRTQRDTHNSSFDTFRQLYLFLFTHHSIQCDTGMGLNSVFFLLLL